MTLKLLNPEELKRAYDTDLREAFPPAELKPLAAMEALRAKGIYDPLCLVDEDGTALGYLLLWKHRDARFLLIDYLCVPAGRRNGGIGARLLQAAFAYYPASAVFLGESEAPTGNPEADGMICRRLRFYERNGARTLGYDTALFGVHFKTICWSREPLPDEGVILQKHREIYLDHFGPEKFARYLQIPLRPGEQPFPVTDWLED